jgi:adenosylcobinamide-GDP ribazoletransferase
MSSVRSAVALLTRFPVATAETDTPGAAAFGLVGAGVGLVGAIPFVLLAGSLGEPWIGAVAAIATMAVVTGALHLDGLADTADAVMARDPEAAERARKDPHVGTGGVVALVLVIAAGVVALVSLGATGSAGAIRGGLVLVAVASASRVVPIVMTITLGRLRPAGATMLGGWFAEGVTRADAVVAIASTTVLAVALGLIGGPVVAIAAIGTLLVGSVAGAIVVALRGGLDGDGMGALIELSLVSGLIIAALAS